MPSSSASFAEMMSAKKRELLRLVQADQPGQHERTAEVDRQSAPGEDLAEASVLGGNDQVATEGEVEAGADRHPFDLGDDGLRDLVERHARRADLTHPLQLVHVDGPDRREVGAGAEVALGAGHDDGAHTVGVGGDRAEHFAELVEHLGARRVLALGPVHGDRGDAVGPFDLQGLHRADHTHGPMGFDPYRQQKRRTSDYVMVAAAVVVVLVLLAWALLG